MTAPVKTAGGIVGRWFGNAISEATAFAAGIAIGPVLGPPVQALKNATWSKYPNVPPPFALLAEGVAQGQVREDKARTWAAEQGIGPDQMSALIDIANTGPPLGAALDAFRRGLYSQPEYTTALRRQGIEESWYPALVALKDVLLSPAELANARQQNYIDQARQHAEAAQHGIDAERAEIQFELVGLPPGVAEGLSMLRRGIIDEATFAQMVAEGHTKTKYTPQLVQLKTQVLSALQYVEARVRGWIDNAAMYKGGALTGYDPDSLDLLHKTHGRPLSFHQTFIGLQRGGKHLDATADLTAAGQGIDPIFWQALQQSDIQQQWYDLAWSQRYNYPSAFVLRALAQTGEIDAATLTQTLTYLGWEPSFVTKVVKAWTGGGGGTTKAATVAKLTDAYEGLHIDRATLLADLEKIGYSVADANLLADDADYHRVKAARDKVISELEKAYVTHQVTDAQALTALAQVQVDGEATQHILALWGLIRGFSTKHLTAAQVRAAYRKGVLTQQQAMDALAALNYDPTAATEYLAS